MRPRWSILAALCLAAAPAWAEPALPPGALALARAPDIVDRFVAAALGGATYYNFMQLPIDAERLARVADGKPLNYLDWSDLTADEPPVIERVRALTGLAPSPDPGSPAYDEAALIVRQEKPALDTPRGQVSLDPPFYVTPDALALPAAGCGSYAMSMHPLKPRELGFITIRIVEGTPAQAQQRCLALMLLRALGLMGMAETASGEAIPADADPQTMLTPQEELFLWLAYRIPVGADRDSVRKIAAERLAGLAAQP